MLSEMIAALAIVDTRLADAVYVAVAMMWFSPDRRIKRSSATAADEAE